jgi:hypothetical protein
MLILTAAFVRRRGGHGTADMRKQADKPSLTPALNAPVVARSGDVTKEQMRRVNSTPIDLSTLAPEPWQGRGGGVGLWVNGIAMSGRKRG